MPRQPESALASPPHCADHTVDTDTAGQALDGRDRVFGVEVDYPPRSTL